MMSVTYKMGRLLTPIVLILFIACKESNSSQKVIQDETLKIESFTNFPEEIDGCSCYFSSDSIEFGKGNFIYMNDFAQISFLKINDELIKFEQTEFKEVDKATTIAKAKGGNYELTIEVNDGIQSGNESSFKSGIIKLTNKNGKTITKSFYGECGC